MLTSSTVTAVLTALSLGLKSVLPDRTSGDESDALGRTGQHGSRQLAPCALSPWNVARTSEDLHFCILLSQRKEPYGADGYQIA